MSGVVFVLALVVADAVEADSIVDPHTLSAATLAIALAILLGFADDVLDIPWRIKLALPTFAALPLLSAYPGGTCVLIPRFLQGILRAKLLELGALYHVYMLLFVVFATNSINILAGLNGLEAVQTGQDIDGVGGEHHEEQHVYVVERPQLQELGPEDALQEAGDEHAGAPGVGREERQGGEGGQRQLDAPRDVQDVVREA